MATVKNFEDLLAMELKDLYSSEKQLIEALPKLAQAVKNEQLKKAIEMHLKESETQKKRLEEIADALDVSITGHTCKAMKGLIEEGNQVLKETEEGDVRDAAIISICQRVEHYEIAGYGCARTFAALLGLKDVSKILQTTLDEEGATDHKLTDIAMSSINKKAMAAD